MNEHRMDLIIRVTKLVNSLPIESQNDALILIKELIDEEIVEISKNDTKLKK